MRTEDDRPDYEFNLYTRRENQLMYEHTTFQNITQWTPNKVHKARRRTCIMGVEVNFRALQTEMNGNLKLCLLYPRGKSSRWPLDKAWEEPQYVLGPEKSLTQKGTEPQTTIKASHCTDSTDQRILLNLWVGLKRGAVLHIIRMHKPFSMWD